VIDIGTTMTLNGFPYSITELLLLLLLLLRQLLIASVERLL